MAEHSIKDLLAAETLDMAAIEQWFDGASASDRLDVVRGIGKSAQAKLFEAAKDRGRVDLEYMVPSSIGPLKEVIHEGHNSLPMFTMFQKRFARLPDKAALSGYNEQAMRWATGPGFFEAREEGDEIAIDYTRLPAQKAEGWPEILPQTARLGRFVYADMVDMLRRVSAHVTIGRAIKKGKETENYFLLCRQDP